MTGKADFDIFFDRKGSPWTPAPLPTPMPSGSVPLAPPVGSMHPCGGMHLLTRCPLTATVSSGCCGPTERR